ncbi:DUF2243 domain-containing protein [Halobacteriales archaeon Cl-PHB]
MALDPPGPTGRLTGLGIRRRALPLVRAGVVLGGGLAALLDVALLRLLLGTHRFAADGPTVRRLAALGDGLVALFGVALVVVGVAFLWRAWRTPGVPASSRAFLGSIAGGFGLYLVVEGFLTHHVLGLHHVWPAGPGSPLVWDLTYLGVGAWLVLTGGLVVRADTAVAADAGRARRTY